MAFSRYRTAPGAGTLAALLLVLIGGSPMYVNWVTSSTDPNTAGGFFLRQFAWPAWSFSESETVENLLAADLKAILVVAFAFLFLVALPGSQLARARGGLSQLLAGWAAYIFAGAFAALVASWVLSNPSVLNALQLAGGGAMYGFFTGWIVGLAALGGRRGVRH